MNSLDYFQTVRAEFSGLFLDNPDKILRMNIVIFGTGSEQFQTRLRFSFDPGTDVFGFCGVFWYHSNSMTNRERIKMCHVLYVSEILAKLCVVYCWKKINNMLCVKIMLICACVMY